MAPTSSGRTGADADADASPPAAPAAKVGQAQVAQAAQAWIVWGVAMVAYVVAVLHRTSFGVAGIDAAHRFHASASVLAIFGVLQLLVYAALQVPVGVLLDRLGPRTLIAGGAFVMAFGQLTLALATSVPTALAGRALVGAGDAMTFISVLRLVAAWFPPRRVPVMTQVTGLVGQFGQVLSAVPLAAVLHGAGWRTAFLSASAVGVLVGALTIIVVADRPDVPEGHGVVRRHAGLHDVLRDLRSAWMHPGTRLGLWSHFVTQFPGTVFALMWGYPFLVSGEGVSRRTASALLTLFVLAGVVAAPVVGVMVQRHPLRRSWLVLLIVGVNVVGWTAVLAWPGQAPLWLLVMLVLAMAVGGPGAMIGFDFARTFNPANRLGTATGIVNVGGFFASLVTILLIGLVLDALTVGTATYDLGDFRVAMCVQYLIWAIGVAGVLITRNKVRQRIRLGADPAPVRS